MKGILRFLKTTLIGGLLVILPLQLAVILLLVALKKIAELLTPITVLFPDDLFVRQVGPHLAAAAVFLALCFVAGLIVRTAFGEGMWDRFNRRILEKVPFLKAINRLIRQVVTAEESTHFTPALMDSPSGTKILGWIVDDYPGGDYVFLIPNAPTPMVGELHVAPRDRVTKLPVSIKDFADVISGYGVGLDDQLGERKTGDR